MSKLKKIYREISRYGAVQSIKQLLAKQTSNGTKLLKPKGVDKPLHIRPNTSDVLVLNEVFHHKCYGLRPVRKMIPDFAPKFIADCGAYTGLSSVYFATRFPEAKIIAVEPQAENFKLLSLNASHYDNVSVLNKALWYENTTVLLGNPDAEKWGFEFTESDPKSEPNPDNPKHSSAVDTITIPEIVELAGGWIDILKIDIEGAEKEIFRADCQWLDQVGILIIELHDGTMPGCSKALWQQIIQRDFCNINNPQEDIVLINESILTSFRQTQVGRS